MNDSVRLNYELGRQCKSILIAAANSEVGVLSQSLYRVLEIKRVMITNLKFLNEALICCDDSIFRVSWINKAFEAQIRPGQIVSPKLINNEPSPKQSISISRLVVQERPDSSANLFRLIPHAWVNDRDIVNRAAALLDELPEAHRMLFNSIFWNSERFERFCRQPSSMIGHHSEQNGNLRHTIEVAEEMRELCSTRSYANIALGVLAAFLHDAGKAEEYIPNGKGGWSLSERGKLLGHKVSAFQWIVEAMTRWNIKLPPGHYESLLHIMTAVPHAPDWMGLRAPVTPESLLLSVADRLSGHDDLMHQTVSPDGGFGRYHKHLKSAPFSVKV